MSVLDPTLSTDSALTPHSVVASACDHVARFPLFGWILLGFDRFDQLSSECANERGISGWPGAGAEYPPLPEIVRMQVTRELCEEAQRFLVRGVKTYDHIRRRDRCSLDIVDSEVRSEWYVLRDDYFGDFGHRSEPFSNLLALFPAARTSAGAKQSNRQG